MVPWNGGIKSQNTFCKKGEDIGRKVETKLMGSRKREVRSVKNKRQCKKQCVNTVEASLVCKDIKILEYIVKVLVLAVSFSSYLMSFNFFASLFSYTFLMLCI